MNDGTFFNDSGTITNSGMLTNKGTVGLLSGAFVNNSGAVLTNYGTTDGSNLA